MRKLPSAFYKPLKDGTFAPTAFTRGPWDVKYAHGGPGVGLCVHHVAHAAAKSGYKHLARVSSVLLRPVPVDTVLRVSVIPRTTGKRIAHYDGTLIDENSGLKWFECL
jgi:hypothetical protein